MKKTIIAVVIIAVLVLGGVSAYAIQGLDEDDSTRILANDGYATQTTNTVGGTIQTTTATLQSVVDNASYAGLHITDTFTVITMDKAYISALLKDVQGTTVSFHFGYNANKTAVTFGIKDGNNNDIFAKSGCCVGEIPYTAAANTGVNDLVMMNPAGKTVAISAYYPDAGLIHWRLESVGTYQVAVKDVAFTDVKNHWGKTYVDFLASRGVASGMTATTFSPDSTLTRAQFVMFLAMTSMDDISGYTSDTFTDVKTSAWYYRAVSWAVANGITSGTSVTTFSPESKITREQMALFAVRFFNYMQVDTKAVRSATPFSDDASISSWAKEAVGTTQTMGILSGYSTGEFKPLGNATRAEAATVCSRVISYILILPQ